MKKIIFIIIIVVVIVITIYGDYRNNNFLNNVKYTQGTIKKRVNISGDFRMYKSGRLFPVYKINYIYFVDGIRYNDYSFIGTEDFEYGFPYNFNIESKIVISYHKNKPNISKPRSKLKLKVDYANPPLLEKIKIN